MTSSGFSAVYEFRARADLHSEPIADVKKSDQVTMPTDAELRNLPPTNEVNLDSDRDRDQLDGTLSKHPFYFSSPARESSARCNGVDGMFLGVTAMGSEVWAHMVLDVSDRYICDREHRALIVFQSVDAKRTERGVVMVSGLLSLAEVDKWDDGVRGADLVERFKFIYDALVDEADGSTDY